MKKRALAIALALCIAVTNAAGAFAAEAEGQAPQIVEEEISLEETTETERDGAEAEPADNAEETIDQIEEKQEETEGEISEADPETENEQENDPESLETAEENPETETKENIEEPVDDITDQDPSESEKEEPAEGQEHSAAAVGEGAEDGNTDPAEENSNKADCRLFDTEVIYNGKEIRPDVEVIYQGTLLEEGTDYQLTYDNNVNVGIGTVTVEAIDNSFEPVTLSFKILPAASQKVTIYNVAQGLKVTWLKVEGATRYNVYRDGELIKTTSVLEITDGDVKYRSGEKFTYKVVATAKDVGESTVARTGTYYRLMPVGIKSVTNPYKGKMTVTYDKSPGSSGYVVRYGLESDMSDAKVITVKGEDTTSRTFNNLQMNKTYYVQVRTYKIENDIRYYSGYCTTKTVKIENTIPAYQIVYQLNGGTNNSANPDEYATTSKTITLANPSRRGYKFEGWFTDAKFTVKITSIPKGSTGKKTVYAKWTMVTYKITYELNGGAANSQYPATYTVTSNPITLEAPTRKGYEFDGWYLDSDLTKRIEEIKKGSTGNKTLYAKWREIVYNITYIVDQGENNNANPSTYTVNTAVALKEPVMNPVKEGFVFRGWYSNADCTSKVVEIKKGSVGDKTLYAKWSYKGFTDFPDQILIGEDDIEADTNLGSEYSFRSSDRNTIIIYGRDTVSITAENPGVAKIELLKNNEVIDSINIQVLDYSNAKVAVRAYYYGGGIDETYVNMNIPSTVSLFVGEERYVRSVTIEKGGRKVVDDLCYDLYFESSDSEIAKVSRNKESFTIKKSGNCTVTLNGKYNLSAKLTINAKDKVVTPYVVEQYKVKLGGNSMKAYSDSINMDVAGYNLKELEAIEVYRSTSQNSGYKKVTFSSYFGYDTGLKPATRYFYKARIKIHGQNVFGPFSKPVAYWTAPESKMVYDAFDSNIKIKYNKSSHQISWPAVNGASGYYVAPYYHWFRGYNVFGQELYAGGIDVKRTTSTSMSAWKYGSTDHWPIDVYIVIPYAVHNGYIYVDGYDFTKNYDSMRMWIFAENDL